MTARKSILTISRDEALQNTRTLILQRAGYHVSSARSDREALDLMEASLMLYNGYDPTEAKVDGSVHNLESPAAMLDMIGFLTMKSGG